MDAAGLIGSITTVVAFAAFVGVVVWATSRKRTRAFEEAANAPFALPDDAPPPGREPGAGAAGKGIER